MSEGSSARGEVERLEPTKAERAAARRVAESKATIPHLYVQSDLEVGDTQNLLADLAHAAARSLRAERRLNGSYRDGAFEIYSRVNIGVVVEGADGLVVPTIFDADTKARGQIADEWETLAAKALNGSITSRELAGGTFTIASGFGNDGCAYLPVINAGQAANLAVGSPRDGFVVATIAADARMISGPEASRFTALIQKELRKANPE